MLAKSPSSNHLPQKNHLGLQSLEEKVSFCRGQEEALTTTQPQATEMGGTVKVATASLQLESSENASAMPWD